ncbi:MAG TPA: SCO family protein [Alphaproteobacteria bacterium]|nr:SCO family protein [Alphaproteobacteria bacterium]
MSLRPAFWGILWILAALLAFSGCSKVVSSDAADFTLTDQHGQPIDLASLRGTPVILTFLYTHCTDTCPLYLFHIGEALARLAPSDGITVLAVTVDPERDTVERLREVTASWPANWHFLTGSRMEVAQVWKNYGVFVEKVATSTHTTAGHGYGVVHTAKLVLIAPGGQIARELKGEWTAEDLATALQAIQNGRRSSAAMNVAGSLFRFLDRCGEFAADHPGLFLGLVFLIMAPGLALPAYLLRTFLRSGAPSSGAGLGRGPNP